MQLRTILNHVSPHKGFVYGNPRLVKGRQPQITVPIRPRSNTRPRCSRCGQQGPVYDHQPARRTEFVPMWGIMVFFLYAMRRVDCRRCGIVVETVPWCHGKSPLTTRYAWFLADWARVLSWSEVAVRFRTSWHSVYRAVRLAVEWGLAHRSLDGIGAIGVDEIATRKGHRYLTVVYQLDAGVKRLLWVGKNRTKETLDAFFDEFGARAAALRYVCSDMWKPYLEVLKARAPAAVHVLDRFHIVAHMNKAVDEVRADEARQLKKAGQQPVLARSRWCLLRRPERLSERQSGRLAELLRMNLKTIKAYLLKEDLQLLWERPSVDEARTCLRNWTFRAKRSRLRPVKKVANMLRRHEDLIMNWFVARGQMSSSAVEGMNNKAKVVTRRSFGFRTFEVTKIALYHALGRLPSPKFAHEFF